jgi:hypothetical protein
MALTSPDELSTTPLGRRGRALLLFGKEFLEFLLQAVGDRDRLVGAIGQNESDEIEDIPAAPRVRRYLQLLGVGREEGSSGHS